jgi:hypothetical protein
MDDGVVLEYEVEQHEREIVIDYRVLNETAKTVCLLTPLSGTNGEGMAPDRAYTFLDEQRVLHVTKRLWPVPDHMDVYMPEVPRMTELPAGCEYTETLSIGIPVQLSHPYMDVDKRTDGPRQSTGIALSVGYLTADDAKDLSAKNESRADDEESVAVDYETAAYGQRLLEGEVLGLQIGISG